MRLQILHRYTNTHAAREPSVFQSSFALISFTHASYTRGRVRARSVRSARAHPPQLCFSQTPGCHADAMRWSSRSRFSLTRTTRRTFLRSRAFDRSMTSRGAARAPYRRPCVRIDSSSSLGPSSRSVGRVVVVARSSVARTRARGRRRERARESLDAWSREDRGVKGVERERASKVSSDSNAERP